MLLAHDLVRNAALDGDMPVPDVIVDLSDVEEVVRLSRAKMLYAPGDRLPSTDGSQMPWESAVYEHPVEGEYVRRRNIYASQARSDDGQYHLTMTVIDIGLIDEQLEVAYYGACNLTLDPEGVLAGFERGPVDDDHEVQVDDGQLLEMLFPVLVANHLMNTGVIGAEDVVPSDQVVYSNSLGQTMQA